MTGAVCYIRVSTAEQASGNNSLPVQEKKLRTYCGVHNLSVLKVFVDPGESARTTDRPEFQKMLTYCREHRKSVSHLIVADLSRFARNLMDQGVTLAILRRLGSNLCRWMSRSRMILRQANWHRTYLDRFISSQATPCLSVPRTE